MSDHTGRLRGAFLHITDVIPGFIIVILNSFQDLFISTGISCTADKFHRIDWINVAGGRPRLPAFYSLWTGTSTTHNRRVGE